MRGDAVDVDSDVALVGEHRGSGVDAGANANARGRRPLRLREGALAVGGGRDRILPPPRECSQSILVAARVDLVAAVRAEPRSLSGQRGSPGEQPPT